MGREGHLIGQGKVGNLVGQDEGESLVGCGGAGWKPGRT